jgi:hypothetical protein
MPELGTSGTVGAAGGQSPAATQREKKVSNHAGWRAKMSQIRLEDPAK